MAALRWCLPVLLLAVGCVPWRDEPPDTLYRGARDQYRHGNLQEALGMAERGLSAGNIEPVWQARFLLLKSEILATSGKPQEALALLESFEPQGPEATEFTARRLMTQALARIHRAEFHPARALLEDAWQLALRTGSRELLAEVGNRHGICLTQLDDAEAAEATLRRALDNARRAGDSYLEMAALGNLGFLRLLTARYDEAIPWFEQLLALAREGGYRRFVAKTLHNLGICHTSLGDLDAAIKVLTQAQQDYAVLGDRPGQEACLGDLGNVYFEQQQYETAADSYSKALALARGVGDRLYEGQWLCNLAQVALEKGDWSGAEDYNRRALERLKAIGDRRRLLEVDLGLGRLAEGQGRKDEAERAYESVAVRARDLGAPRLLIEAQARLGLLYIHAGRRREADAQFREFSSTIASSWAKLERDEWKITYQTSVMPFYRAYVDLLVAQGSGIRALEIAESCRARLLRERLGIQSRGEAGFSAAAFRQVARRERAVLLSYWVAPRRSFLWVVTPGEVVHFILPSLEEIASLVSGYDNAILNLDDLRELSDGTGRRLHDVLLGPAAIWIRPGARVILVPDGPLHRLNFETLLAGEPPRYWMEDVTLSLSPSLGALLAEAAPARRPPKSVLLLGNPVSPAPEWPPLADAANEIQAISGTVAGGEALVLTGRDAYAAAYAAARPADFQRIHFSAHAAANPDQPLDSAVILSRHGDSFKLYARDVARIPLRAEMVTVSACRSAGARSYSGEGLVGFAWAFLQAGARNVVAGLWDVNDRSTALLMSRLYQHLKAGLSPEAALRAAKLELLRDPVYRLPYYWAPFVVFTRGGGAAATR